MPWKFSGVPEYAHAHGYFSRNFNGLLFRLSLQMCEQNLKSVAFPVPEIIGVPIKIWAVSGYAHALFSPKFLMGFCSDGPCYCSSQIKSVSLPVPEIIPIGVLGGVANPQSWGRGGLRESGMVPFERALVSSYRASMVIFPLSLRVSEIGYCRFCAPARHFFPPHL